ncbi:MAG: sugar phosphate isomerase/epimerase [Phycisphaerales bacterium]|nr:sugar phosphate isomerase/epimerase [Phycisphaerales bacterium]
MTEHAPNPISLAQWSLHREIRGGRLDPIDFPRVTREVYGLDAVEYVNSFYRQWATDEDYFRRLRRRCDELGVRSLLIMCDGEGALGDPDEAKRARAIENHRKWLEAARILGCHSIRVNAQSGGTFDEQLQRAADGLRRLGELAATYSLNVLVENHGGLSSNGAWLAAVMELVGRENVGTLPDFGNFNMGGDKWYDRYTGVRELMPFAKAVSAKSHEFDADGNEVRTDYARMMEIVRGAGYTGYVGIEWEGGGPSEEEGILLTKRLLERCGCVART